MKKDMLTPAGPEPPPLMIRTDADSTMGSGHLMRCLAMAREWRNKGGDVWFAGRIESRVLRKEVKKTSSCLVSIDRTWPHANDIRQTKSILSLMANKNPWVLLDGYHFDEVYLQAIKKTGCRLMVIDDTGHLNRYGTDILLNPNPHAESIDYRFDSKTRPLLGGRYFLLRDEFLEWKKDRPRVPDTARHILLTMGAADHNNHACKIIRALKRLKRSNLDVVILAGPLNIHRTALESELAGAPFSYQLHTSTNDMAAFMWRADLAVSAGGGTAFELAYMGVPAAVTATADNQRYNVKALEQSGAAVNLGPVSSQSTDALAAQIDAIIDSKQTRTALSAGGKKIIDGKGAKRAAEMMAPTRLTLRKAEPGDCDRVFQWANDPTTRANSYRSAFIPRDEHCQWFLIFVTD